MKNRGFTLIELITSIALFTIIVTLSMGSLLNIFDANRKSRSLKTVINNLNLAMESMSREMRYGRNYHCGSGDVSVPQNCSSGGDLLSFLSSENTQITYRFNNSSLEKRVGSGSYTPVTAPEIVIDDLKFFALGAGQADSVQPKVLIKIKSHAGTGKSRSDLTIQTLVSQRIPDLNL